MPVRGSTVIRRQLGRQLRRIRDAAGKTEADVEESGVASRVKLWRIETGRVATKVGDVYGLCQLYEVDTRTRDVLAALALGTKQQGFWEDFSDVVPTRFSLYRDLVALASEIRVYGCESIPPLLQTPDYAHAYWQAVNPETAGGVIREQVRLLHERQEIFYARTPQPRVVAVLSDGVLARLVGGREVMANQVAYLHDLNRREQVDIRVLTWAAGAHPSMHIGPFTIMDFANDDDRAVVCVGTLTGTRFMEKPFELGQYRRTFAQIYTKTQPIEERCVEALQ